MSEQIKLSEQEQSTVKSIGDRYSKVLAELGSNAADRLMLQKEMNELSERESAIRERYLELSEEFNSIQADEVTFANEIQKKYGDGELNIETGEFTPTFNV